MLDKIVSIYSSYASYLWKTISNPFEYDNYFYYLIYVSLFVWILEMVIPWRKDQKIIRNDFWIDTFFMFFNFYLFNLLVFTVLSTLSEHYFRDMMMAIGLPEKGIVDLSKLPLWSQFILFFLISDFIQWAIHNLLHRSPVLWKFHKVHHSVTEMGFAAHLRYHWVETFVYKTGLYIFLSWLLHFELQYVFFLHAFTILVGHLNHANLALDYGPLRYILNNPKMHIWHHAKSLPEKHKDGANFGISLSLWDYLFGTNYMPHEGRDIELGFEGIESYPKGFFHLLIHPFKDKK